MCNSGSRLKVDGIIREESFRGPKEETGGKKANRGRATPKITLDPADCL